MDDRIVDIFKTDKAAGIRRLYDLYYDLLVVYAGRLLRDHACAEDLVQEFFIRLWNDNYLKNITSSTALKSYLFTGIRNSAYTTLNKKDSLRNAVDLSEVEIPAEVFLSIDNERIARVMQEIEKLPNRTRQVVEEVILNERKYKEVAEELHISVNTVKTLLKEGSKRVRDSVIENTSRLLLLIFEKK